MSIAVLETGRPPEGLAEQFGDYPKMIEQRLGATFRRYAALEGELPETPEAHAAYIITGSPSGVYDPDPWIRSLIEFLQAARGKAAFVGICFGHQVLAEAFGGKVEKSSKGWGIGLHSYDLTEETPFQARRNGGAKSIAIPVSHQDQVVVKPDAAKIIAASAFTPYAGLYYPEDRTLSFQCHPEFEPDFAAELLRLRRGTRFSEDVADTAIATLRAPNSCTQVGAWIGDFIGL